MQKKYIINVDDLLLVVILLESFCGMRSVIRYAEMYIITLGTFLCFYKFVKNGKLHMSKEVKVWLVFCAYLVLSLKWSISADGTLNFVRTSVFGAAILMVVIDKPLIIKYLKAVYAVCLTAALSIILELFYPSLIADKLWFFFEFRASGRFNIALLKAGERYNGAYSGIIGEKGDAAFFMCLGLSILFSKCFARKKFKVNDILGLAVLMIALLLTGKRMLFLISIAIPLLLLMISDIRKERKLKYVLQLALTAVLGLVLMINLVPGLGNVFIRLSEAGSNDGALSERYRMWNVCLRMFYESPVTGYGVTGFNNYAYHYGLTAGANAHNIYIQLLGETGLAGMTILFCFLAAVLIRDINLFRMRSFLTRDEICLMYFSFCGQFIFLFYGLSGNTLYYRFEFVMYFMCLLIMNILSLQLSRIPGNTVIIRGEHG